MDEHAANYWADDGYRYGVRFEDGSVRSVWNGRTQRAQAESTAIVLALKYDTTGIQPVRRKHPDGDWQTYLT